VTDRRTLARGLVFIAVVVSAAGTAASGSATPAGRVPRLIFPLVGPVAFANDFGAARYSGTHQGNDLMAPRRTIAVAAEPGKVKFWTTSASAGCMLYLYGKSGTTYLYIHLNNDVTKKNDNRGNCVAGMSYAKGLKDGASVEAGQPVGYVGNSGDADSTDPHLHFEVHPNDGGAVNPYPYLKQAERLIFPTSNTTVTLTVTGTVTQVVPDDQVTVKVVDLQAFPAGVLIQTIKKPLKVVLTNLSQVDLGDNHVVGAGGATSLVGRPVLVLTAPTYATLAAAAARPRAYTASRIVLSKPSR
jgi:Peptidase family M23